MICFYSECILITTLSCLQWEELHTLRITWYDYLCLWMLFVQDVASLNTFFQTNFSVTPEEKQLSVSGKNWGEVDLNGICIGHLTFDIFLPFPLRCLSSYRYICRCSVVSFETMSTFCHFFASMISYCYQIFGIK